MRPIVKRLSGAAVPLALVAMLCALAYHVLPASEAARHTVNELASAHAFSLGAMGYGADRTQADTFFKLVQNRHADELLRTLYERGTPEAKLYALCGLRHVSPRGFPKYAERFAAEVSTVHTVSGCIGNDRTATEILPQLQKDVVREVLALNKRNEIKPAR